MDQNRKRIFQSIRKAVILTKLNPKSQRYISNATAYAWRHGVFPLLNKSELAISYEDQFDIRQDEVSIVHEYLEITFMKGSNHRYKHYHDYFVRNDLVFRSITSERLCKTMRYIFLTGVYPAKFWEKMLERPRSNPEARSIALSFNLADLRE